MTNPSDFYILSIESTTEKIAVLLFCHGNNVEF
jgi:hypothetical protein